MQGYLLEHAFDSILEAGEVPQPSVFLEMVFQATVQHDYKRAVTLITVMAHASFQVTERQWTELFCRNNRSTPEECWENLLVALRGCPLQNEPTVMNLSRSLSSLCRSDKSGEISSSMGQEPVNSKPDTVDDRNLCFGGDNPGVVVDGMPDGDKPDVHKRGGKGYLVGESHGRGAADAAVPNGIDSILSAFRLDEDLEEEEDDDDDQDVDIGLEYNSDEDEEIEPDIPSAEEILQMWRESRQKNDANYL